MGHLGHKKLPRKVFQIDTRVQIRLKLCVSLNRRGISTHMFLSKLSFVTW